MEKITILGAGVSGLSLVEKIREKEDLSEDQSKQNSRRQCSRTNFFIHNLYCNG